MAKKPLENISVNVSTTVFGEISIYLIKLIFLIFLQTFLQPVPESSKQSQEFSFIFPCVLSYVIVYVYNFFISPTWVTGITKDNIWFILSRVI